MTMALAARTPTVQREELSNLDDHDLQHLCEQSIRNYDPCISCSTHFLDFTVERR